MGGFQPFVKKTGMPEGSERKMSEATFLESFGKIETPRRVFKKDTKAFRGKPRKALVETNFTEGFS